jgi:hypothetical protein
LAQHIGVLIGQHLAQQFLDAHPAHVGHRGARLVGSEAPTILKPAVPTYRPPSQASYTTRRDATGRLHPRLFVKRSQKASPPPGV